MEKEFKELEENLVLELKLHDSLLTTAQSFNSAVKNDDLEAIQKYTRAYDEHICQIERLEEKRVLLCTTISGSGAKAVNSVKLDSILTKASSDVQSRIRDVRNNLKRKIQLLSKVNTSNQILIHEAMELIATTFKIIGNEGNRFSPYNGKGKGAVPVSTQRIFNKIV